MTMCRLTMRARQSARFRRHSLGPFKYTGHTSAVAECVHCKMWVEVDTNPPANGIDIGGSAVALDCTKRKDDDRWARSARQ